MNVHARGIHYALTGKHCFVQIVEALPVDDPGIISRWCPPFCLRGAAGRMCYREEGYRPKPLLAYCLRCGGELGIRLRDDHGDSGLNTRGEPKGAGAVVGERQDRGGACR